MIKLLSIDNGVVFEDEILIKRYELDESSQTPQDPIVDLFILLEGILNGDSEEYNINFSHSKLSYDELLNLAYNLDYLDKDNKITENGFVFISNEKWIKFYVNFLSIFNFNEFKEFFSENNFDLVNAGYLFINKHIEATKNKRNFKYLTDSYTVKAMILDSVGKYK